jgi:hypothetical protein
MSQNPWHPFDFESRWDDILNGKLYLVINGRRMQVARVHKTNLYYNWFSFFGWELEDISIDLDKRANMVLKQEIKQTLGRVNEELIRLEKDRIKGCEKKRTKLSAAILGIFK